MNIRARLLTVRSIRLKSWHKFGLLIALATIKFNYATTIYEAFSFSCSHCYSIEGTIEQLHKQQNIEAMPIYDVNDINQVAVINTLFATKHINKEWLFRNLYFKAVFQLNYPVYDARTLNYVLSTLNLNNQNFYNLAASESVINDMQKNAQFAARSNITGTPTFLVNGIKYEGEQGLSQAINNGASNNSYR